MPKLPKIAEIVMLLPPEYKKFLRWELAISGTRGKVFEPMIELSQGEWFKELKRSQGNFAFGFQRVKPEKVIGGFQRVAETSS